MKKYLIYLLTLPAITVAKTSLAEGLDEQHTTEIVEAPIEADGKVLSIDDLPDDLKKQLWTNETQIDQSKYIKSRNKNTDRIKHFLQSHLVKLSRLDDINVLFMFKSSWPYGLDTQNGRVSDFVLKVNHEFNQIDDHGHTKFKLLKINDTSILIEYASEFDHNSFGKDLITIDEGEIELNYIQ